MSADIIVIGGGLLGSLIAWRLSRRGDRVRVYEQGQPGTPVSAAYTAAAMVAPFSERPLCGNRVFSYGCRSLDLWPQLLDDLQHDTGIRIPYNTMGSLLVAHPSDQAELTQFEAEMRRHGLLGADSARRLSDADIQTLEPDLAGHFSQGFWLPREAQIDNRQLLQVLRSAAIEAGADWFYDSPVHRHGDAWLLGDASLSSDRVIDTRGTGARRSVPGLRGVRGETVWVECPEVRLQRPVRLLHPRYHLYLVPRGDGKYQLGATEIESEDRSPVSVRSAMEMLSALWAIAPQMAEARILSLETNLRPALPDHLPMIDTTGDTITVNGLFRHGYLLAPALLEKLAPQLGDGFMPDNMITDGRDAWMVC
jgi:glycine oxidase